MTKFFFKDTWPSCIHVVQGLYAGSRLGIDWGAMTLCFYDSSKTFFLDLELSHSFKNLVCRLSISLLGTPRSTSQYQRSLVFWLLLRLSCSLQWPCHLVPSAQGSNSFAFKFPSSVAAVPTLISNLERRVITKLFKMLDVFSQIYFHNHSRTVYFDAPGWVTNS